MFPQQTKNIFKVGNIVKYVILMSLLQHLGIVDDLKIQKQSLQEASMK